MSTNPAHPDPPHILEYRSAAKTARPSARDIIVGVLCSLACVALCIWVCIAFVGGVAWLVGQHWLIGVSMLLSAIVGTPPACYAAGAAESLFSGKNARGRA